MTNRCYVAFWAGVIVGLIAVARWLLHDYADYLLVTERLGWYAG